MLPSNESERRTVHYGLGGWRRGGLAVAAIALLTAQALAVQPGRWVNTTEADYTPGKSERVVITNLGDIKLAMKSQTIGELPEQASIVNALQRAGNGDVYLATGPDGGKIFRLRDQKIEEVASLPGEQVFAMAMVGNDRLIVGVSGATSRLAELRGGKLETLIELPEVRYIWDMLADARQVIIATGSEGKVLAIDLAKAAELRAAETKLAATRPAATASAPATRKAKSIIVDKKSDKHAKAGGKASTEKAESRPAVGGNVAIKELLASGQTNVLCLARDKQGRIYAGTDDDGLIFRITLRENAESEAMVIYDASEPEIGALLVTADGTIYAGTADAEQARPGRLGEAASTEAGRPEPDVAQAAKAAPAPPLEPPPPVHPKPAPTDKSPATAPAKSSSITPRPAAIALAQRAAITPMSAPLQANTAALRLNDEDDAEESPVIGGEPADSKDATDKAEHAEPTTENPKVKIIGPVGSGDADDMAPPRPPRGARPGARPSGLPGLKLPIPRPSGAPGSKEGNAVYRITPDGFVSEVFRESVMILRIVEDSTPGAPAGRLLVATGNEGKLFRVDPAAGETTILDDIDAQQIPTLLANPDGSVLAGTANPASLVRLEAGFAPEGTFISAPMDASQISRWGHLAVTASIPKGAKLSVETRSGNVQDPDQAAWAPWSKQRVIEHDAKADPLAPIRVDNVSPAARFLQYRLTLKSDGKATPIVDRVELSYITPNLKPVVNSVQVGSAAAAPSGSPQPNKPASPMPGMPRMARLPAMPGGGASGAAGDEPEPQTSVSIEWDVSDPNTDRMKFTLEYQPAGTAKWLPLAKDLDQPSHEWQTRRVPDGRYVVRVTATDAPDNTPETALTATRQSDPVTIDNTPPALDKIKTALNKNTLTITGSTSDALSTIKSIHYALDTTEAWKPIQSDDGILDSTGETFTATLAGLSPGPHVVTLRAVDTHNNARYENVLVEVPEK